ncbi:MAG TPA: PEP-CTERM sorting domain-containing protein [Planctomycetaceae bacterium]|nr:PEP-CTERM sorting domain-containing protein [Planctomycetaceae bacterium]
MAAIGRLCRSSCFALVLAAVTLLSVASPAKASLMGYDVSFSASNFQVGAGSNPAPVDPVTGEFKITLDPTLTYTNDTADISLTSLNIVLGSALSFSYSPTAGTFPAGTLRVGGLEDGSDSILFNPSTNDFWLQIANFATSPAFTQVGYTQTSVSSDNLFYTLNQTGSVTVTPIVNTPEPTSICLLGLGFASFGLFRWKQKSITSL